MCWLAARPRLADPLGRFLARWLILWLGVCGGIIALRGHANVQGATDIPTLFSTLPNYLPSPHAVPAQATLAAYLANGHASGARRGGAEHGLWQMEIEHGAWAGLPRYLVSLLKAWYGDAATAANEYGYQWLPKLEGDQSEMSYFVRMHRGEVKGLFLFGQNPAVGGPNARLHRDALRKLEWMVVLDLFETESAAVWKNDPGGPDPKTVGTEVFLLPVAAITEKSGSVTNTERLVQWHEQITAPPGACKSDLWLVYQLGLRLKALYAGSTLARDQGLLALTWDYTRAGSDEPDPELVLREINGYQVAGGSHLHGTGDLRDDGSTACGSRLYAGVFPAPDQNLSKRLDGTVNDAGQFHDWGWAWPGNTRVLYNRASADPTGEPWSERKKLVWWDAAQAQWTGLDVPNWEPSKPPAYRPELGATGMAAIPGDAAFNVHFDGKAWLFAPFGLSDGPLPVYYEPVESPFRNALYTTQWDPGTVLPKDIENPMSPPEDPNYPLVATTYRVTEHYLSGAMTRFNSWVVELQPAMFVEIGPELAAERGVGNGDWVVVSTPRGAIEARCLVTPRLAAMTVHGQPAHVVGMLIHFGYQGEAIGASANLLSAMTISANADIQSTKSFACQLRAGRLVQASGGQASAGQPIPLAPLPDMPLPRTPWAELPEGKFEQGRGHGH